jgi:hypothetical protein
VVVWHQKTKEEWYFGNSIFASGILALSVLSSGILAIGSSSKMDSFSATHDEYRMQF